MAQDKGPVPTVEAFAAANLRRRIERLAHDLHKLADEVAARAADLERVGDRGIDNYTSVATNVQSTVINRLPNLSLDNLATWAAEADVARAKGE